VSSLSDQYWQIIALWKHRKRHSHLVLLLYYAAYALFRLEELDPHFSAEEEQKVEAKRSM
jgi:hypothetical protein